jgi:2-iminobutanoate/2-iminopropanoate deaminase
MSSSHFRSLFPTTIQGLALLSVLLLVGCGGTEAPAPERQALSTSAAPAAIGPYSQAIQVGNTIYCSGQIGIDPETDSLVAGGIEAETRQVLDNLQAVLEAGGASMDDVVQAQVFLASLDDYAAMNEVYGTYFEDAAPPARAAVEAATLPAGARVEIMVTARK